MFMYVKRESKMGNLGYMVNREKMGFHRDNTGFFSGKPRKTLGFPRYGMVIKINCV